MAQGGSLSPLLGNIALNGIQAAVTSDLPGDEAPFLICYADDILILHPDLTIVAESAKRAEAFLEQRRLRLNHGKEQRNHTADSLDARLLPGFTFLRTRFFHNQLLDEFTRCGLPPFEVWVELQGVETAEAAEERRKQLAKIMPEHVIVTTDTWYPGIFDPQRESEYRERLFPGPWPTERIDCDKKRAPEAAKRYRVTARS